MKSQAKQSAAERFQDGNLEAARIILADTERYPGVMQEWARLILSRAERTASATGRAA